MTLYIQPMSSKKSKKPSSGAAKGTAPSSLGPLGSGAGGEAGAGGESGGWLVAKEPVKRGSTSDGDLLDFVHAAVQVHPSDFEVRVQEQEHGDVALPGSVLLFPSLFDCGLARGRGVVEGCGSGGAVTVVLRKSPSVLK
jgi:hypothetical protein